MTNRAFAGNLAMGLSFGAAVASAGSLGICIRYGATAVQWCLPVLWLGLTLVLAGVSARLLRTPPPPPRRSRHAKWLEIRHGLQANAVQLTQAERLAFLAIEASETPPAARRKAAR